jgi:DNA-binding CsgD family transcriptional regulator/tetratricopeptide (TPR) repeat protein
MNQRRADATPYVGRRAERDRALAALRDGVGVIATGVPGSGRRRFTHELADQLGAELGARLRVGDDLSRLDERQAHQWSQAVRAHEIVPIAVAQAGRDLPAPIEKLQRDGGVIVVELGPLSARELLALAEGQLGGPLAPSSVPTYIPAGGGDDLAAITVALAEAVQSGALRQMDDVWTVAGPTPPSTVLRSIVSARAADLRSEAPHADVILDVLALAPGLRLSSALAVLELAAVPADTIHVQLEHLENAGAIAIDESPWGSTQPRLRIRDGIDELILPLTIDRGPGRRLEKAIVDVLGAEPVTELVGGELIALARHGIMLRAPLSHDVLIRAARASLRTPDSPRSLQIATAAMEAGGGFDAQMTVATAEAQAGLAERALARLASIVEGAADDVQRMDALQAMVRHVRESEVRAVEIIDSSSLSQLALVDARREMLKGLMLYNLGDPAAAIELIEPALPDLTGLELAEAWFHVGAVHLIMGHTSRAAVALDTAEVAYTAAGADAANVHMVRAHVNVLRGRVSESLPVVRAFRDMVASFAQPVAEGMCGWALGNLLLSCGAVHDAIEEYGATIRILEAAGLDRTRALVRMDLALARALSGDEVGAFEAMPWSSPDEHGAGLGVSGKFLQVEGWIHASAGRREEARAAFIRSSETHGSGGFLLPSFAALVDAARVSGAGELLERVEELAIDMDGEYVAVLLRFARALAALDVIDPTDTQNASRTASEFDAVGTAAARIDQHIIAAEAFDHAADLHRASGETRRAVASARLRDARISTCGLTRLPLVPDTTSSALTPRELQLANLAATGLSNRDIAEHLVLSVRTVETHLQKVYLKLGVRTRSELREALDTR